jgi:Na+/proline symporter
MIIFGDISPTHLTISVLILGFVGIIYTLSGGITSVIYSDCLQIFVFLTAAIVACFILFDRIPADFSTIVTTLSQDDKLTWLKSGFSGEHGFDITDNYTLITSLTGFVLFNMAAYGTDQDLTQRMLTCKNSWSGSKSAIQAILLGLPVTFIFMSLGLLLYIFYQKPELMGGVSPAQVDDSRKVFLHFILMEMPVGMAGLMMAGLFAAGLSSLNSALNAMASSIINDHYRHMAQRDEAHYLKAGRLMVVLVGFLLCGMAMLCIQMQKNEGGMALVDFALYVMVFAYSGLLGVFLCARFTQRGNGISSLLALIIGFISILLMQPDFQFWVTQPEDALKLAFPWQMFISSTIAFIVCCIPPSPVQHD